jgi:hypothetical protein
MSDPRYTDPYRSNPSGRGTDAAGMLSWLVPLLTTLGLLIGGFLGYNWGYSVGQQERSAQVSPHATTGSAPSEHRPAPGTP